MQRSMKILSVVAAAGIALAGCSSSSQGNGQKAESSKQQSNYDKLVAQDPAHTMSISATRATINFWIDTWGHDKNKLAYVYLMNTNGDFIGYYVFKGLPVSYCTALTPTYKVIGNSDSGYLSVPAPSVDGAYYSGGDCNRYYGRDGSTGAYIEFTAGLGINVLLYDKPLDAAQGKAKPLGPSK